MEKNTTVTKTPRRTFPLFNFNDLSELDHTIQWSNYSGYIDLTKAKG